MLLLFSSLTAAAQPPARLREQAEKQSSTKSLTVSSSAREFPTAQAMPSDVVWRRDIYRMLDLTKDENAVLYYPTTPQDGRENLFTFLFKQMLRGQITAYDYTIDGNEDFSEKLIFASSFYGVIFENCRFDRSRFFACFFEKAVFINCSFKETESKYNIVGNSTIQNTSFAGSDILFSNFIGALIENTDFSETDLYSSTFFRARLKQVNFSNCNLKKTDFRATKQESVLFRYSNYEEAFFDGGSVL